MDVQKIVEAATAGGKVISRYFGQILEVEQKSAASDFRTKADTESEAAILEVVKKHFPDFNIFSEEIGTLDRGSEFTFIIDPLDGSNNFVLGIPNFTVSIALMKGEESIAGVIHSPILNQTYVAETGKGAFLDGRPIHVNQEADVTRATVSYTCGYINSSEYSENLTHKLNQLQIKRQLNLWSPAYDFCMLASGKIEAMINNKNDLYDYAAGVIMVREAGGKISGFKSEAVTDRSDTFVASNGTAIHEQILAVI